MTARLALDCRNIVGESLVWSAEEAALWWVDIVGSHIHRFHPASGAHAIWPTPELPTSIGLRSGGGFIVGLRRRVALWRPDGPFETLAVPEPDLPGNRLNEGVVAPDGSFWVGTMAENIGPDGSPQPMAGDTGALYRITADGTVRRLCEDRFGISNTMVWLDDGRFVTADTLKNALYLYAHDAVAERLTDRRELAPSIARGLPDGSARDRAGRIYNARVVGGAAIVRIDPDKAVDFFDLPCRSPTSCAFGGADLRTLYVTSSRFGMSGAELATSPAEGGLFALDAGAEGLPPHRFG